MVVSDSVPLDDGCDAVMRFGFARPFVGIFGRLQGDRAPAKTSWQPALHIKEAIFVA